MSNDEPDRDDLLLERLQAAASGDAAVRQLRRRYDQLREDYEQLLDRLAELEGRLEGEDGDAQPEPRSATGRQLAEDLAAPLLRLRDEYAAALENMQGIVAGLETLAAGTMKGQHTAESRPAPAEEPAPAPQRQGEPRKVQVDVRGGSFGELLDFQERLSELGGVRRVSINAIDSERATLVVELSPTEQG